MPVISKIDETGAVVGEHDLREDLLESEVNIGLLHEVVRSEMAAHRQGTRVGQEPRRGVRRRGQALAAEGYRAGAGRLRRGSRTGPTGAWPSRPSRASYEFKVNKKVRAKAFRMALGDLVQSGTSGSLPESRSTSRRPSGRRRAWSMARPSSGRSWSSPLRRSSACC